MCEMVFKIMSLGVLGVCLIRKLWIDECTAPSVTVRRLFLFQGTVLGVHLVQWDSSDIDPCLWSKNGSQTQLIFFFFKYCGLNRCQARQRGDQLSAPGRLLDSQQYRCMDIHSLERGFWFIGLKYDLLVIATGDQAQGTDSLETNVKTKMPV